MAPHEELTTTGMASDGRAVARRPSGQVVFVEGALPGEKVAVTAVHEGSRYAAARAVDILDAAPERIVPPCPRVAEGCGGCQWQHVSLEGQRDLKVAILRDALTRIGRIDVVPFLPTVDLPPWAWRTSIRAGVTGGRAALRRHRSHELVPAEGCLVAHPLLTELLSGRRYGRATSVLLRCGARTGERLAAPDPGTARIDVPPDVRGDHFHEEAAGRRWRVSAGSFFQSRPDGADALADLIGQAAAECQAAAPPGAVPRPPSAVDAYSGVGLFAGRLAQAGWTVTAVEGSRSAVSDARINLADLPVSVVKADVTRWRPAPADLVVADPSRSGLGPAAVARLERTGARRLVLVSCDAASLGRDAALLTAAGFGLTSVRPVDLFPQTWRVEVVSIFDRPRGRSRP